jgi:hypothetical protein
MDWTPDGPARQLSNPPALLAEHGEAKPFAVGRCRARRLLAQPNGLGIL